MRSLLNGPIWLSSRTPMCWNTSVRFNGPGIYTLQLAGNGRPVHAGGLCVTIGVFEPVLEAGPDTSITEGQTA